MLAPIRCYLPFPPNSMTQIKGWLSDIGEKIYAMTVILDVILVVVLENASSCRLSGDSNHRRV